MCQESLKKFREEAEKLEKSESLQKAREKYVCLPLVQFCTFCIQTVFVVFILFFVHIAYSYLLVWIFLRLKMLFIYRTHKWLCCTRRSFHVAPILNSLKFSNLASSTMNPSCLSDTTTDTICCMLPPISMSQLCSHYFCTSHLDLCILLVYLFRSFQSYVLKLASCWAEVLDVRSVMLINTW